MKLTEMKTLSKNRRHLIWDFSVHSTIFLNEIPQQTIWYQNYFKLAVPNIGASSRLCYGVNATKLYEKKIEVFV